MDFDKNEIVIETIDIPKDQVYLIAQRKPNETLLEWAKRCAVAYNIGEPKNEN